GAVEEKCISAQQHRAARGRPGLRAPMPLQPPQPFAGALAPHPHRRASPPVIGVARLPVQRGVRFFHEFGLSLPRRNHASLAAALRRDRSACNNFSPKPDTLPAPWVRIKSPGRLASTAAEIAASAPPA